MDITYTLISKNILINRLKHLPLVVVQEKVLPSSVLYKITPTDYDGQSKSERRNKVPNTVPF